MLGFAHMIEVWLIEVHVLHYEIVVMPSELNGVDNNRWSP